MTEEKEKRKRKEKRLELPHGLKCSSIGEVFDKFDY